MENNLKSLNMDWALGESFFKAWWINRERDPQWIKVEELRLSGKIKFWISPLSISKLIEWFDTLDPNFFPKHSFNDFWKSVQIYSIDSMSVKMGIEQIHSKDLQANGTGFSFSQAEIDYQNFNRLAPSGVFISMEIDGGKVQIGSPAHARKNWVNSIEAALELYHERIPRVPMLDLEAEYRNLHDELDQTVLNEVSKAHYILGPSVKKFETGLAEYLGSKYCVGVSSGTESLVLSLRALAQVRFGKERLDSTDYILTTPFTFVATGDAILRSGATPLFVDVDPVTLNIDVNSMRQFLEKTQGKISTSHSASSGKVIGIIPVHLFGLACPMDEILKIAHDFNLFILEDVAQAFGANWKNQKLGALGDLGSFSFFPSKNLGSFGDAGSVATDDSQLAEAVMQLLKHGSKEKNNFEFLGYNARLDSLQAAVLLTKLPKVDGNNALRKKIAQRYIEGLKEIAEITLPVIKNNADSDSVFHQFTIRTLRRNELQKFLETQGVASMLYYPYPLHQMKLFKDRHLILANLLGENALSQLPVAEDAARCVISLPIGPSMQVEQIDYVIECIRNFFKK